MPLYNVVTQTETGIGLSKVVNKKNLIGGGGEGASIGCRD